MECVLAVDIGTQTVRSGLMRPDGGFVDIAAAGLDLHAPQPGWAEQSPAAWWRATTDTIAELVARNTGVDVAAIAVGAQMHGLVPVDSDGLPLVDRAGIWSDKRATGIVDEYAARDDIAELVALAGNVPLPAWPGFKQVWYQRERPDVAARAVRYLVIKDFITARLSGAATTDPSEASGTWLMDAGSGAWSPRLLDALEIDESTLPRITPAHEVVGGLLAPVAADLGLPAGTPVVCGGGDMLCQLLAAGVNGTGRVCEVSGTASIMAANASAPALDPRVMNLRGLSGGWVGFGIADAGGATFRWFVDRFCETTVEAAGSSSSDAFGLLAAKAEAVPVGSQGLLFLPYLLGERTMGSPRSRGSIVGLTPGHGRPEMVRALLEGITFELRRTLELIDASPSEPLRVVGGGATSALWNRIRAAVYGRPVARLEAQEGGLLGAGLLAAVGAGWFPDPATAAEEVIAVDRLFDPDPHDQQAYEEAFDRFCDVHDRLDGRWGTWESGA